jgi:hypothetical protein
MSLPDRPQQKHDGDRVRLLVLVFVLVLGATAIPVELRRFDFATISLRWSARDLVENLILYVPVGVVLARLGFGRAVTIATLLCGESAGGSWKFGHPQVTRRVRKSRGRISIACSTRCATPTDRYKVEVRESHNRPQASRVRKEGVGAAIAVCREGTRFLPPIWRSHSKAMPRAGSGW